MSKRIATLLELVSGENLSYKLKHETPQLVLNGQAWEVKVDAVLQKGSAVRRSIRWIVPAGPVLGVDDEKGNAGWNLSLVGFKEKGTEEEQGNNKKKGRTSKSRWRFLDLEEIPDLDKLVLQSPWWNRVESAFRRADRDLGRTYAKKEKGNKSEQDLNPYLLLYKLESQLNAFWAHSGVRTTLLKGLSLDDANHLRRLEMTRQVTIASKVHTNGRVRLPHLSHRYRICPFHTPESKHIGLQLFISATASRTEEGEGKGILQGSPLGDSGAGADPEEKNSLFSVAVGMVPYPFHSDGPRLMMGGKNLKQAEHGIAGAEAALVPGYVEGDFGKTIPCLEGHLDDQGRFSPYLGTNALVAVMPWKGFTYEDGLVVSESFADRLKMNPTEEAQSEIYEVPEWAECLERIKGEKNDFENYLEELENHFDPMGKGTVYVFGDKLPGDRDLNIEGRICLKRVPAKLVRVEVAGVADRARKDAAAVPKVEIRYVFEVTRPLRIGDKITGRNGNKGVVTRIEPDNEMPKLVLRREGMADHVETVDLLISPCSIVGRKNLGQILEMGHGLAMKAEDRGFRSEEPIERNRLYGGSEWGERILPFLKSLGLEERGFRLKMPSGEDLTAFCGYQYIARLHHHVDKKLQARGKSGPYNGMVGQPASGGPQAGQRLGEMENWAVLSRGPVACGTEDKTAHSLDLLGALRTQGEDCSGERNQPLQLVNDLLWLKGLAAFPKDDGSLCWEPIRKACETVPSLSGRVAQWLLQEGENESSLEKKNSRLKAAREGGKVFNWPADDIDTIRAGNAVVTFMDKETSKASLEMTEILEGCLRAPGVNAYLKTKGIYKVRSVLQSLKSMIGEGVAHPLVSVLEEIIQQEKESRSAGKSSKNSTRKVSEAVQIVDEGVIGLDDDAPLASPENTVENNIAEPKAATESEGTVHSVDVASLVLCCAVGSNGAWGIPCNYRLLSEQETLCGLFRGLMLELGKATGEKKLQDSQAMAILGALKRYREGLDCFLKGKKGLFRNHLLGHRVNHCGRAVIVPDPELPFDQARLPVAMAVELLMGHEIAERLNLTRKLDDLRGKAHSASFAKRKEAAETLNRLISENGPFWCLLVRQPSLHRHSMQAFQWTVWEEMAMAIPPLITEGFNADFDGDTMAVFLPPAPWCYDLHAFSLSEAPGRLGDGSLMIASGLDLALGWTALDDETRRQWLEEAGLSARGTEEYAVALQDVISGLVARCPDWPSMLTRLQRAICRQSTGICSFSPVELQHLWEHLGESRKKAEVLDDLLCFNEERAKETAKEADSAVAQWLNDQKRSHLARLVLGKAKGKPADMRQMCGFLGLQDCYCKTESKPLGEGWLSGSFWGGLSEEQLFKYSYASRESMGDKKLATAKAGYFSRQLAEGLYNTVVEKEDCLTEGGMDLYVRKVGEDRQLLINYRFAPDHPLQPDGGQLWPSPERFPGSLDKALDTVLKGRWCHARLPFSREAGDSSEYEIETGTGLRRYEGILSDKDLVCFRQAVDRALEQGPEGETLLVARCASPLTCEASERGVCRRCAGADVGSDSAKNPLRPAPVGMPVGLNAAMAIGERGTQLAMKRFHQVGSGGEGDDAIGTLRKLLVDSDSEKSDLNSRYRKLLEKVLSSSDDRTQRFRELPQRLVHFELALKAPEGLGVWASSSEGRVLEAFSYERIDELLLEGGTEKLTGLKAQVLMNVQTGDCNNRPEEAGEGNGQ